MRSEGAPASTSAAGVSLLRSLSGGYANEEWTEDRGSPMSFAPRHFTLGQKLVAFVAMLLTGAAVVLTVVVPGAIETAQRRHS